MTSNNLNTQLQTRVIYNFIQEPCDNFTSTLYTLYLIVVVVLCFSNQPYPQRLKEVLGIVRKYIEKNFVVKHQIVCATYFVVGFYVKFKMVGVSYTMCDHFCLIYMVLALKYEGVFSDVEKNTINEDCKPLEKSSKRFFDTKLRCPRTPSTFTIKY